jgi:Na+-translocating ferredoxin:NAD+ oxidoreductase RnfG subunit
MAKQSDKYYQLVFTAVMSVMMLLVSVTNFSADKVAAQEGQDEQTLGLLRQIFSETGSYSYDEELDVYTVYDTGANQIGYAFYAGGDSYAVAVDDEIKESGPMVFLVGLDDKETIKSVVVISQEEDPDYWKIVESANFFSQFNGLKITACALTDYGGEVDSASGATISSMSVVDIIREVALAKVLPEGVAPQKNQMEWQVKLALAIMIPIMLIPVTFTWYSIMRQRTSKAGYS